MYECGMSNIRALRMQIYKYRDVHIQTYITIEIQMY